MNTQTLQTNDAILEILLQSGSVTPDQVEAAKLQAEMSGISVLDQLLDNRALTKAEIARAKAAHYGASFIELSQVQLSDEVIQAVPADIARRYQVLPVFVQEGNIKLAISDPSDLNKLDTVQRLLQCPVEFYMVDEESLLAAIQQHYGNDDQVDQALGKLTSPAPLQPQGAEETAVPDAPVIKLVNRIIEEAYRQRASDIHFEPLPGEFRIRYRIDGILRAVKSPPLNLQPSIISRLKTQANMAIDVKRLPQDGRIHTRVDGKQIDLRVSCVPTNYGESIVIRILDKEGLGLTLSDLGLLEDDQEIFEQVIATPDGMILVTGPTGSGKTTTLYSVLQALNREDRKIITVEDPVEYLLSGVNQVQVNEAAGMTFAGALRSILRQSPNIILIGEVRDTETANIAMNAALTGHLVFSTLHTNDAPSAITRLIDMGVKPFLIASAARAVLAQRLVRRVCSKCAETYDPPARELERLEIEPATCAGKFTRGKGCPVCQQTGYRGRLGLFELFTLDDAAQKLIYEKATAEQLADYARKAGMRTLRADGVRKILLGMTTPVEVVAATLNPPQNHVG